MGSIDILTIWNLPTHANDIYLPFIYMLFNSSQQCFLNFSIEVFHIFCQMYSLIFHTLNSIANSVFKIPIFIVCC